LVPAASFGMTINEEVFVYYGIKVDQPFCKAIKETKFTHCSKPMANRQPGTDER